MDDMFDCGCDGVSSREWRVHNNAEAFNLEISLAQGFKEASIVEVVVKGHSKVRVCNGGDKCGMFGGRGE